MSDTTTFRPGSRGADVWPELDGAGFIRHLGQAGWDAPHVRVLRYRIAEATSGKVTLEWEVPTELLNPAGIAHGGFLTALLDDAAGLAVASTYPRFVPQLTVQLSTDFIGPVLAGATYRVVGEVVRRGRSTSLADASILSPTGEVVTRATGVFQPNRRVVPRDAWADAGL